VLHMRSMARRALRRLGLEKIHHPSFVDLMIHEGIRNVLDVGANCGHYGTELRERGYSGRIASFEPIGSVFAELERRSRADPLWDVYNLGVGDAEGHLDLSVSSAPVFSSFKAPSDYTEGKFVGARQERIERVPVVRLDNFLAEHPDYLADCFLKIDTQGFEKEVLTGAGSILSRFRCIQLELPLRQLYVGQETMMPMMQWMADRGFQVAMAKENGFDWDTVRLLELDVVFVRDPSA
jgi:FkbM family methyltransferase